MNLTVYAESGAEFDELEPVLNDLAGSKLEVHADWLDFLAALDVKPPDAVLIDFAQFIGNEPRVAIEAREQLRERGIPAVALVSEGSAAERRLAEMIAGFEVVVEGVPTLDVLAAAVADAAECENAVIRQVLTSSDYPGVEVATDADGLEDLFHSELEEAEREEAARSGSLGVEVDQFGLGDVLDADAVGAALDASFDTEGSWGDEAGVIEVEDAWIDDDEDWSGDEADADGQHEQPSEAASNAFAVGGPGVHKEVIQAPTNEVEPDGGWARWDDLDLEDEGADEAAAPAAQPAGYDDEQLDASVQEFLHDLHEAVGSSYEDEISPADEIADELGADFTDLEGDEPLPADLLSGRVKAPPVEEAPEASLEVREWGPRSRTASGSAAYIAATEDEPELLVKVEFPDLLRGSIADVSPIEVLVGHQIAESGGRLVLTMDRIQREIFFKKGVAGLVDVRRISDNAREKVVSALAWDRGTYSFTPGAPPSQAFASFGNLLEFVYEAVSDGLTLNQALQPLTPFLKRYPVPTNRLTDNRRVVSKLPDVERLVNACGDRTLEDIAGAGIETENRLKAALFAYWTRLIVFVDEPRNTLVTLDIDIADLQSKLRAAPSRSGSSSNDSEADDRQLMTTLVRRAERFQKQTAYQILGVQEGCGAAAVKDAYYKAVKSHHPDTYALAKTPSIKPMAEMVFRLVRKAYSELEKREPGEGGRGRPTTARRRVPTAGHPTAGSSGRVSRPSEEPLAMGSRPSTVTRAPSTGARAPSASVPRATRPSAAAEVPPRGGGAYHVKTTSSEVIRPPSGPRAGQRQTEPTPHATSSQAARISRPGPAPAAAPTAVPPPRRPARRRVRKPAPRSGQTAPSTPRGNLTGAREAVRTNKPEMSPKEHFKAGLTMLSAGQSDRALEEFREANEGEPENISYLAHHAWAQYLVDPDTAEEVAIALKRAIAESDESTVEWPALFMGHLLSAEGQEDQAVSYYRECLHGNPRNVEAKRRLRLHDMRAKGGNGFLDKLFSSGKSKSKDTKKRSKR